MLPSMRRYKSKAQRPCDFCRQRRAACRIVESGPCELCKAYSRDCTFLQAPPPRRRGAGPGVVGPDGMTVDQHQQSQQQQPSQSSGDSPAEAAIYPVVANADATEAGGAATATATTATEGPAITQIAPAAQPLMFMSGGPQFDDYHFEPLYDLLASGTADLHNNLPPIGEADYVPAGRNGTSQAVHVSPGVWPGSPAAVADVGHGVLIGPTDPMDPYVLRQYYYDDLGQMPFKRLTVRSVVAGNDPVQFLIVHARSEESSLRDAERRAQLSSLVPEDVGARLLILFYRFISPQFPVLSVQPQCTVDDLAPGVLAGVYLLTLDLSTYDDVLCIQTMYEEQQRQKLREFALACLHEEESQPTLSSVQAALLLILAPPEDCLRPDNEHVSSIVSVLVSMAHAVGLQYDPTEWNLSPADKVLRRSLSCLVLVSDVWVAAATGRPPIINPDNWLVEQVVPARELAPTMIGDHPVENFVRLVDLSRILQQVLLKLFSLRESRRLSSNLPETLAMARPVMEELEEWQTGWHGATAEGSRSSFLSLSYHTVRTLLFRAMMRPLHNSTALATADVGGEGMAVAQQQVRLGARACASAFTAHIEALSLEDLQAFWPFWAAAGFALHSQLWLTLLLSAPVAAEAAQCCTLLSRARSLLRTRARSFGMLRLALLRADSVWWRGIESTVLLSPAVAEGIALASGT